MNSRLFDKCVVLAALSLLCFLYAGLRYSPKPRTYSNIRARDLYVEFPDLCREKTETIRYIPFEGLRELNRQISQVPITVSYPKLVLYESHTVFLTAYCAEECGWNYATSSGATCHREDDSYEPSTCAIDLRYFSYGTMFYVPSEDRVYIAEDTGVFRGMWIDTYQHSMSDVYSYNTRYETVYTCGFEEYEITYQPPNDSHDLILFYMSQN